MLEEFKKVFTFGVEIYLNGTGRFVTTALTGVRENVTIKETPYDNKAPLGRLTLSESLLLSEQIIFGQSVDEKFRVGGAEFEVTIEPAA